MQEDLEVVLFLNRFMLTSVCTRLYKKVNFCLFVVHSGAFFVNYYFKDFVVLRRKGFLWGRNMVFISGGVWHKRFG